MYVLWPVLFGIVYAKASYSFDEGNMYLSKKNYESYENKITYCERDIIMRRKDINFRLSTVKITAPVTSLPY